MSLFNKMIRGNEYKAVGYKRGQQLNWELPVTSGFQVQGSNYSADSEQSFFNSLEGRGEEDRKPGAEVSVKAASRRLCSFAFFPGLHHTVSLGG